MSLSVPHCCRQTSVINRLRYRSRYEQVQDARHAEESVLRARDAQIFELLQTNERLDLDLLDSEAQAERAKSRVNELERLRAQLVTELADSKT